MIKAMEDTVHVGDLIAAQRAEGVNCGIQMSGPNHTHPHTNIGGRLGEDARPAGHRTRVPRTAPDVIRLAVPLVLLPWGS